jgi:succinate dehydrogenase flavin-adding protein (antitoxin of CptAB toxin-antitoxin module)
MSLPADRAGKTGYIHPQPKKSMTMTEDITIRRKRLIHRSLYTGMKETDLLLGGFARKYLGDFSSEELDIYETLLEAGDPNIYVWAVGREEVPAEYQTNVMALLQEFTRFEQRSKE